MFVTKWIGYMRKPRVLPRLKQTQKCFTVAGLGAAAPTGPCQCGNVLSFSEKLSTGLGYTQFCFASFRFLEAGDKRADAMRYQTYLQVYRLLLERVPASTVLYNGLFE